jgi:hypothetical protein
MIMRPSATASTPHLLRSAKAWVTDSRVDEIILASSSCVRRSRITNLPSSSPPNLRARIGSRFASLTSALCGLRHSAISLCRTSSNRRRSTTLKATSGCDFMALSTNTLGTFLNRHAVTASRLLLLTPNTLRA